MNVADGAAYVISALKDNKEMTNKVNTLQQKTVFVSTVDTDEGTLIPSTIPEEVTVGAGTVWFILED